MLPTAEIMTRLLDSTSVLRHLMRSSSYGELLLLSILERLVEHIFHYLGPTSTFNPNIHTET